MEIWASLKTPDDRSRRHWVLMRKNSNYGLKLPIAYESTNRFMMFIERWMCRHCYKWFDVSW